MARNEDLDELSRIDLFSQCSRHELEQLAPLLTRVTVPAGELLIREGGRGNEFMVLAGGQARVAVPGADGTEQEFVLGPGDFIGEMALLSHSPRSATVTAVSDLTLYVSTPGEFRELLVVSPSVAEKITTAAEQRRAADGLA